MIRKSNEMLEIENSVTGIKSTFERIISTLDIVKERINEVDYTSIKCTQTET